MYSHIAMSEFHLVETLEPRLCLSTSSVGFASLPRPRPTRGDFANVGGVTVAKNGDAWYTITNTASSEFAHLVRVTRSGRATAFNVTSAVDDTLEGLGQTADGPLWFVTRILADEQTNGATH